MGTYWYPVNWDDHEYFDPHKIDDNAKYPVNQTAVALFELFRDAWRNKRVSFVPDTVDLPWEEGLGVWTDISDRAKRLVAETGAIWAHDEPADMVYRTTFVLDENAYRQLEDPDWVRRFLPQEGR